MFAWKMLRDARERSKQERLDRQAARKMLDSFASDEWLGRVDFFKGLKDAALATGNFRDIDIAEQLRPLACAHCGCAVPAEMAVQHADVCLARRNTA